MKQYFLDLVDVVLRSMGILLTDLLVFQGNVESDTLGFTVYIPARTEIRLRRKKLLKTFKIIVLLA